MVQIIISIFIIILLSAYNGYFLLWHQEVIWDKKKLYNTIWHSIGAILRVLIVFVVVSTTYGLSSIRTYYISSGVLLMSWIIYDVVLNYIRLGKFFYDASENTNTGSWIDRNINGWKYYALQVISFILGVILLIL